MISYNVNNIHTHNIDSFIYQFNFNLSNCDFLIVDVRLFCIYDCECVPEHVLYTRTLKCYYQIDKDIKEHPKLASAFKGVSSLIAPTETYNLLIMVGTSTKNRGPQSRCLGIPLIKASIKHILQETLEKHPSDVFSTARCIDQVWVIELVQENWNNDLGTSANSCARWDFYKGVNMYIGPFGSMLFDTSLKSSKHWLSGSHSILEKPASCWMIILCTKRWRNVSNVNLVSKHLYMNSLWNIFWPRKKWLWVLYHHP